MASAPVRGTTFSIDCTAPDGSCAFTVIEGVVTVTPRGSAPVEVHTVESVTVHKDGGVAHDPARSPDQLGQVPWIAKNTTIDTAEPGTERIRLSVVKSFGPPVVVNVDIKATTPADCASLMAKVESQPTRRCTQVRCCPRSR